jgi:WD40 repeat protein
LGTWWYVFPAITTVSCFDVVASVQQQDLDQCSQRRAYCMGSEQIGNQQVWWGPSYPLLGIHPIFALLERRSKDHIRSIHAMSVSHIVHHYCITGSADGDMRVWVCSRSRVPSISLTHQQDLRDLSRSLMRIHHPTSVRSVVFSPSTWQPLHAIVGLDNGSIYR